MQLGLLMDFKISSFFIVFLFLGINKDEKVVKVSDFFIGVYSFSRWLFMCRANHFYSIKTQNIKPET